MAGRLAPKAYERLLAACDASDVSWVVPDDVWALLLSAYGNARLGRFDETRARIREATTGDAPGLAFLIAGVLLYVCRDHAAALEAFEEATAREPRLAVRALGEKSRCAGRLGWAPEARAITGRLLELEPERLRWRLDALRLASRTRDWEAALEHADAALALEPGTASVAMERARILAALGRDADAREAARAAARAMGESPRRMGFLLEAARIGFEVGAYEMTRAHLEAARRLDEGDVRPSVSLAQLALFESDHDAAERALAHARSVDPDHPLVLRTEAAMRVMRGEYDEAVAILDRVIAASPSDGEAHLWRGEALIRLRRWEEGYRALHHATMNSEGYLLPAWILRSLGRATQPDDPGGPLSIDRLPQIPDAVEELIPGARATLASGDRARIVDVLERALACLHGNRTPHSSHVVDGRLRRISVRTSPRHASRHALQLIRSASPERVLAALDAVVARYPKSSLPICHRGELRLWLGDLEGARRDLQSAIALVKGTRWAWIGLTGIENEMGRPEEALEVSARGVRVMNDTTGASVYAYRADAAAALGRWDEALADLETSVALSESRLGAWVSLASVLDARGDHARAAEVFAKLVRWAPGLLSDAAREEAITLFHTWEADPTVEERRRIVDRALRLLGGNRSSTCVTYRTSDGTIRLVPRPGGRHPHDTDDDDLHQARTLLLRATGQSRRD